MKQVRILLLLAALPIAFLAVTQFNERRETAGLDVQRISPERLKAHTTLLSDDLFEGRAPGSRGGDLAARYIASQFALLGLEPAGDDGTYFQAVPLVEAVLDAPRFRLTSAGPKGRRAYALFRSDHFPFARAGVPALSLSPGEPSTGSRSETATRLADEYIGRHYHQPSDEVLPEWDWTAAADDTRIMADLGWRIAADPRMPAHDKGDQFAQARATGSSR